MKNEDHEASWGLPDIGIPAEVLFHPELTDKDKILFGFLRNLSQTDRGCWASNRFLGILLDSSIPTISRSVQNLKKHKFIITEMIPKKMTNEQERRIYINPKYPQIHRKIAVAGNGIINKKGILKNEHTPNQKCVGVYSPVIRKDVREDVRELKKKEYKKESENFLNLFPLTYQKNKAFLQSWNDFVQDRKERKIPLTKNAVTRIINKCVDKDIADVIEAINYAIEVGYRGIFFKSTNPSNRTKFKNKSQETSDDNRKKTWVGCYPHD